MALSRVTTWIAGQTLTASALNAEFDNILNNAASLFSPLTATLDLDGNTLVIDSDADSTLRATADDVVALRLLGFDAFIFDGDVSTPVNGITFTSAATGAAPAFTAHGETNVPILIAGKGTGAVHLGQATSTDVRLIADQPIADSSGNELIKFTKAASAVNEITVANAATGAEPSISATGGDTDIDLKLIPKGAGVVNVTAGGLTITAGGITVTAGGLSITAGALNQAQGSDVASDATINLDTATGNLVDVTGTTTITAITLSQGRERTVRFTGALTLTHGASLVLPGAANIVTVAGDFAIFRGYGSGVVRCVAYTKANGTPVITPSVLPRGYMHGLTLSNNGTDAINDIDIAAGRARDVDDGGDIVLAAALTKRLDAAWAVGSGNGGLDTGSIANTTYHVWLIKRSDTGVVDALFSTSVTSPTMPANYDYKRRIGSIIRSGGAILAFDQFGDKFVLDTPVADISATGVGTSAVTRTLASVPTGIVVTALVGLSVGNATQADMAYLSALASADLAPSLTAAPCAHAYSNAANIGAVGYAEVETNTNAQIRSRSSSANSALYIITRGWIDRRGRDD